MQTVAEKLKKALVTDAGKTVTDLAAEIEMSRPALSNVLNGNADLSIHLALKLERLFQMDARKLLISQLDAQIAAAKETEND